MRYEKTNKTILLVVDNGITIKKVEFEIIKTPWGDRVEYNGKLHTWTKDGYLKEV